MKASMADDGEEFILFTVGTIVSCKTCFNQEFEGEVLAFDYQTKMLVIKSPSTGGKANLNDVHMINLDYCQNITVKKEGNPTSNGPQVLPPLNLDKLSSRFSQHVKDRKSFVAGLAAGVTSDGIKLYAAIKKTICEVNFQGKNIIVMNQVSISPPYRPDNCKLVGKADENALNHVRKIVEKFIKDQQTQAPQQPTPSQAQSRPHLQLQS